MIKRDSYTSPLTTRYASQEMSFNFSDNKKYVTWRKLWYILAKCELSLGMLGVTRDAVQEMGEHLYDIDYDLVEAEEERRRHDGKFLPGLIHHCGAVMAHIHTFGVAAPLAAKIIHLGATSCFVTDNADLIMMRDGLDLLIDKLATLVSVMRSFCLEYKDMPCLGFTHFQPAQLTTLGKRASMWLQDLVMDLEGISRGTYIEISLNEKSAMA
jgi:adenylosuccinate lyase